MAKRKTKHDPPADAIEPVRALTELEALRLENAFLKRQAVEREVSDLCRAIDPSPEAVIGKNDEGAWWLFRKPAPATG